MNYKGQYRLNYVFEISSYESIAMIIWHELP